MDLNDSFSAVSNTRKRKNPMDFLIPSNNKFIVLAEQSNERNYVEQDNTTKATKTMTLKAPTNTKIKLIHFLLKKKKENSTNWQVKLKK